MAIYVVRGTHEGQHDRTREMEALRLLKLQCSQPSVQKDAKLLKVYTDAISLAQASLLSYPDQKENQSREVSVVSSLHLDTSGKNGGNGYQGTAGQAERNGSSGTNGAHGEHARDIHLRLTTEGQHIIASWHDGIRALKLQDPTSTISMRAVGGNGGQGGNGGPGGQGIPGVHGRNATQYSYAGHGTPGTSGGIGANGGNGGNAGNGGNVTIYVRPEDADLLMLIKPPEQKAGTQGNGGLKGGGGRGGPGGLGGKSYTWRESVTYSNPNGIGGYTFNTVPYSYSNPEGEKGLDGLNGVDGFNGMTGNVGRPGVFQMSVEGVIYHSLYNLELQTTKMVDLSQGNPDEIYEPGEQIHLSAAVANTGGMPTPLRDIEFSLVPSEEFYGKNTTIRLPGTDQIAPQATRTLQTPFSFQIKEQETVSEEPYYRQAALTYRAVLPRINRSFSSIDQKVDQYSIRYPVQISRLTGKVTQGFEEKFTFTLSLQNISSIAMGKEGPQKRRLFVVFEISQLDTPKTTDIFSTTGSTLLGPNQMTVEVDNLLAKSEQKLEAYFRFDNSSIDTQTKVRVVASLYLDHFKIHVGEQRLPRCIQKRTFQM